MECKKLRHAIFDIETLSTNVHNGVVVDVSLLIVDQNRMLSDTPYTCRSIVDVKKVKFSVEDQTENYGWKVCPDTLKFWKSQPIESRKHIAPKASDLTVADGMNELFNYATNMGKCNFWWTRGNNFDPIFLRRMADAVGRGDEFNRKFGYNFVRDMRTFIDAKLGFGVDGGFCPIKDETFWGKVFVKHDSSWDVLADALRIQAILRAEEDLEFPNR